MPDRTYEDLDHAEGVAYGGYDDDTHSHQSPAMLANLVLEDFDRFCLEFGERQVKGLRDDTDDHETAVATRRFFDVLEEANPAYLAMIEAMLTTSFNCGVLTGIALERKHPA